MHQTPANKHQLDNQPLEAQATQHPTDNVYQSPQGKKDSIQAKQRPVQRMQGYQAHQAQHQPVQRKTSPNDLKTQMGNQYGVDLSGFKEHQNSSFPGSVNALATIQGKDIHYAPGQYTTQNRKHELGHAIDNTLNGTPKGDKVVNGQSVDTTREKAADKIADTPLQLKALDQSTMPENRQYKPDDSSPIQAQFNLKNEDLDDQYAFDQLAPENLKVRGINPPENYIELYNLLKNHSNVFNITITGSGGGFKRAGWNITVGMFALGENETRNKKRLIEVMGHLGHEMQHAADQLNAENNKIDEDNPSKHDQKTQGNYLAVMKTELNAWATEGIIYKQLKGEGLTDEAQNLINGWEKFNPSDINEVADQPRDNIIWQRLMNYGVSNGYENKTWKECLKANPRVLEWAMMQKLRFGTYDDKKRAEKRKASSDSIQINTYTDLRNNGLEGKTVQRHSKGKTHHTYIYDGQLFEIAHDYIDHVKSEGTWQTAETASDAKRARHEQSSSIRINTYTDLRNNGLEGKTVQRHSKGKTHNKYTLNGQLFEISHDYIDHVKSEGQWQQ